MGGTVHCVVEMQSLARVVLMFTDQTTSCEAILFAQHRERSTADLYRKGRTERKLQTENQQETRSSE